MSASWWLEALKITEKIIRENAFQHMKKKPVGVNFKLGPGAYSEHLYYNWGGNNIEVRMKGEIKVGFQG